MALGVLFLLAALIWPCAENIHVNISCSMDWVMVSVGPCAYSSSLYIFADELYLGLGCPVTRIQTYAYDFIYPVHDCGIRTKVVSEDTLLFQTEIYLNPRNAHCDCQKIPLECSASRKSVWLTLVSTDNEIRLDPSPFIADFETTPEEVGLLNPSQTVSLPKEKWKFGIGIMNFVGKNIFIQK
ncbi:oocyte-secreted protein 2 isoform X3 [Manis pentadactyla]|uniref:oocyte-secreted protein 2 isoform X3 n=2 Tax=Manis pentadactyla TaxID=143292 RepID=UPI00255C71D9|nr:oocyte-secreted protein 2 isoform X3 [Manis pentadactyla]